MIDWDVVSRLVMMTGFTSWAALYIGRVTFLMLSWHKMNISEHNFSAHGRLHGPQSKITHYYILPQK